MAYRVPATPFVEARDASSQLLALLRSVAGGRTRIVLAEEGVPVGAIVSTEDLARLTRMDAVTDDDDAIFAEVRAAFADVPGEEIERETDRILGINQDDSVVER